MDAELLEELKKMNLLPIGINPSGVEIHYLPGTPQQIIDRCETIHSNVEKLYNMADTNSPEYHRIEEQIKLDLHELNNPTSKDVLNNMVRAYTGTGGVARDVPSLVK